MAQFRFKDATEAETERREAIESLIPGTIHFYHLYFLDLAKKKKKLLNFSPEDKKLFKKFEEKHQHSY